jgi:hypothetical protein
VSTHIGNADDFDSAARNSRAAGCFDLARVYSELALARASDSQASFRGLAEFQTYTLSPSSRDKLLGTHWYRNGTRGAFHLERSDWVRSGKAACGGTIKNPGYALSSPMLGQSKLCRQCVAQLLR